MPWQVVLLHFQLYILSFALSTLWNISENSFKVFSIFLIYIKCTFTKFHWLHSWSPLNSDNVNSHNQLLFLQLHLFSIHSLVPVLSLFIYLLHVHLWWPILFWLPIFAKCQMDLSLGNKQWGNTTTCFVHKVNKRCIVINRWQTEMWCDCQGSWHICYLCADLWVQEL